MAFPRYREVHQWGKPRHMPKHKVQPSVLIASVPKGELFGSSIVSTGFGADLWISPRAKAIIDRFGQEVKSLHLAWGLLCLDRIKMFL